MINYTIVYCISLLSGHHVCFRANNRAIAWFLWGVSPITHPEWPTGWAISLSVRFGGTSKSRSSPKLIDSSKELIRVWCCSIASAEVPVSLTWSLVQHKATPNTRPSRMARREKKGNLMCMTTLKKGCRCRAVYLAACDYRETERRQHGW